MLATPEQIQFAKGEYEGFVLNTWNRLRTLEQETTECHSSLNEFCRIDVGIFQHGGGLHYFVNEVERGNTTFLWSRDDPSLAGRIGPALGAALTKWLTRLREYMSQ